MVDEGTTKKAASKLDDGKEGLQLAVLNAMMCVAIPSREVLHEIRQQGYLSHVADGTESNHGSSTVRVETARQKPSAIVGARHVNGAALGTH